MGIPRNTFPKKKIRDKGKREEEVEPEGMNVSIVRTFSPAKIGDPNWTKDW